MFAFHKCNLHRYNPEFDALRAATVAAGKVKAYFFATVVGDGSVTIHYLAPLPAQPW
jgi:hypothetical protein